MPLWWLILACVSRIELSNLSLELSELSLITIFILIPLTLFFVGLINACCRLDVGKIRYTSSRFLSIYFLFFIFLAIFFYGGISKGFPLFSYNPNEARLLWGLPVVHVMTEVIVRLVALITVAKIFFTGKIQPVKLMVLGVCVAYTILVVSRSFLLELLFYVAIGILARIYIARGFNVLFRYSIFFFISIVLVFVLTGNLRQEDSFDIVDYGNMIYESNILAWFYGYFLVNFDNLILVIDTEATNSAFSNIFGPILNSTGILSYLEVNDYPYVGRFNLGTAYRSYIMDFGIWGVFLLAFFWLLFVRVPFYFFGVNRLVLIFMNLYFGFTLPITSRFFETPYFLSYCVICLYGLLVMLRRNHEA